MRALHYSVERKRAEKALWQSEEKYRLLVDQVTAVLFHGFVDWSVDFFNNKIESLTGFRKEEFDSREIKWCDLILPEDLDNARQIFIDALKTDKSYVREYRIRRKDGEIRWVHCRGRIFCDAKGDIEFISGVTFDITERKQAEEALRKYKFIANTAKDCMTLINRNYIYEAANAAFCQAHGKTREEVVGTSLANIWGEDRFKNNIKGYLDRCFTGQAVDSEGWFEFGKRGRGCYHVFYTPYFNEDGTVAYAAVVSHDITDRKRDEKALRQSEAKYRQLVQQIPMVVYKGYTDWSLECFDQKVEEITGYSMETFNTRQKTWLDLILPEDVDQTKKLFKAALKGDGSYVNEHRIRKKTGEVRWIQARNRIIRDAAGKVDYISGVFFDISQRKSLEDQFLQAQKMEVVGNLAGGVAHDFNNLLSAIMGYAELIKIGMNEADPCLDYVEETMNAAQRAAALTRQLLAFSHRQILQPQVINLNFVISDLGKMLRRLINENIELTTVLDPELALTKADPGQIEQVLMNLVINASDAMPSGGNLTIRTGNIYLDNSLPLKSPWPLPGNYVVLMVSDTGMGMDAEILSHVFEPFFTTKKFGKGTGLGLSTVYGIVKQSGGYIEVDSNPGMGTTFKIYLPQFEGALQPKEELTPSVIPNGSETILLVEDDEALKTATTKYLEKYGYSVLQARDFSTAMNISERHEGPIHLLLTDIVMPHLSGPELSELMASFRPEMKVIYMSGYSEALILDQKVLDYSAFLQKPFKPIDLVLKIRAVLDDSSDR